MYARPLAVLFAVTASASGALAQSWAVISPGLWNEPTNWTPQTVPDAVGASASIVSTAEGGPLAIGGTFTFDEPVTLGSLDLNMGTGGPSIFLNPVELIFDNGGAADVFISAEGSGAVNINGPITLMGDLISTWGAPNAQITGSISGAFGVTHQPPLASDRIRLWGANAYTGETRVLSGRLSIVAVDGLGAPDAGTTVVGPGTLVLGSPSAQTFSGEALTLQSGGRMWMLTETDWADTITLETSGEIAPWFDDIVSTVSGRLTGDTFIRGSARSRASNDPLSESVLIVSNTANDYTGGTIIRSGVLAVPSNDALGAAGTTITFDVDGFSEGPPALATSSGTIIDRDIDLVDDGWLRAGDVTACIYTGAITGAGDLTIGALAGPAAAGQGFDDWTGAVALQGENTYAGVTTVKQGTLVVDSPFSSATGTGPVVVEAPATLTGGGIVGGPVDMTAGGVLAPGGPTGSIILGPLAQGPDTITRISVAGLNNGQFDEVVAGAPTTIDGELVVTTVAPYTPSVGDTFDIVSAASVTGTFATETLPDGFEVEYHPNRVTLVYAGSCPADLTGDGAVDAGDLGVLLAAWGTNAVDLTGDGVTGTTDLGVLIAAWGECD